MMQRTSLSVLAGVTGRDARPLLKTVVRKITTGLTICLALLLANLPAPSEARPGGVPSSASPAEVTSPSTQHLRMPLIMRNVPALDGWHSSPSPVVVRVQDTDGNPIEGARIVGLYTDEQGQTTSESRVTDENGEAVFPASAYEIIFEVQFPAGVFPCPDSPPRAWINPGETSVQFIGCRR